MRRQIKHEEREDSDKWLKEFMPLYEKANPFIQKVIKIDADTDSATVKSFVAAVREGYQELSLILRCVKAIPKPKEKELGKLRADFERALIFCISAATLAVQFYKKPSRFTLAKLVWHAGLAKGRMEDFSKRLVSVSKAISNSLNIKEVK